MEPMTRPIKRVEPKAHQHGPMRPTGCMYHRMHLLAVVIKGKAHTCLYFLRIGMPDHSKVS